MTPSSRSALRTSLASPNFPDSIQALGLLLVFGNVCPLSRCILHFCDMTKHGLAFGVLWIACGLAFAQTEDKATSAPPYTLEVATEVAHQPGLTKYLISVKLPEGDRVSSVYGTDVHPLTVRAPKGVFNSPYNGSWSASGMNPKFFEIMPDMADDTYATIGLSTAAKMSGMEGAEDPTMVQDPGSPWDEFFTESGETDLDISTHTGGAYFVLRTAANGAGQDGRVFLMQVTTEGDLSGAINLQLFPASSEHDQVRCRFEFNGKGEFPGMAIE